MSFIVRRLRPGADGGTEGLIKKEPCLEDCEAEHHVSCYLMHNYTKPSPSVALIYKTRIKLNYLIIIIKKGNRLDS